MHIARRGRSSVDTAEVTKRGIYSYILQNARGLMCTKHFTTHICVYVISAQWEVRRVFVCVFSFEELLNIIGIWWLKQH